MADQEGIDSRPSERCLKAASNDCSTASLPCFFSSSAKGGEKPGRSASRHLGRRRVRPLAATDPGQPDSLSSRPGPGDGSGTRRCKGLSPQSVDRTASPVFDRPAGWRRQPGHSKVCALELGKSVGIGRQFLQAADRLGISSLGDVPRFRQPVVDGVADHFLEFVQKPLRLRPVCLRRANASSVRQSSDSLGVLLRACCKTASASAIRLCPTKTSARRTGISTEPGTAFSATAIILSTTPQSRSAGGC